MVSRLDNLEIGINQTEQYKELRKSRGIRKLRQYFTPELHHPTVQQISSLNVISHIWSTGDRLYKLADKFYGDSQLWWIIAWFNQKPNETFFNIGEVVHVPLPLEQILRVLDV